MKIKLLIIGCSLIASIGISQTVTDVEGNVYNTTTIGAQVWMAENLKTIKLNDGSTIGSGQSWYNHDSTTYANQYGALYTWYTVNTGKLCPTGWHVPSDDEWTTLANYLTTSGYSGKEGEALKSASGWNPVNGNGTDIYGFKWFPSGYRHKDGRFLSESYNGYIWSNTNATSSNAYCRNLRYGADNILVGNHSRENGYSVRCFREDTVLGLPKTVSDTDGNVYNIVKIGNLLWLAENLKTTSYNDGSSITSQTDSSAWGNLITGHYCYFNNDSATYANDYGALYNWSAVNTGKLCPTGWNIPSNAEWTSFEDSLKAGGHDGEEGKVLKSSSKWFEYNTTSTDPYGFNGLPGGYRLSTTDFSSVGDNGYWWSATEKPPVNPWDANAYYRILSTSNGTLSTGSFWKENGYSVRCLSNDLVTSISDDKIITGNVYPNPTKGNLTVEINNPSKVNAVSIKVLDAQSSEVFNQLATNTAQTIDVSSWAAGIYFIHILNGAKTVDVKKVVVNK